MTCGHYTMYEVQCEHPNPRGFIIFPCFIDETIWRSGNERSKSHWSSLSSRFVHVYLVLVGEI